VRLPALTVVLLVFTLVLTDFFDPICTLTGLGKEARFIREDGVLPNAGRSLFVDALGAVAGGAVSSSNTVYVESASGIADGARTGLANVVTGLLFPGAMFLTPLYPVIPIEAAPAPALVVVGALMVAQVREIDFSDFAIALPTFLTIVIMPFTYSIANGIGAGFISWVLLYAVTGRTRAIHPLMWVVAATFAVYFVVG